MKNLMENKMIRITYASGNWDEVVNVERFYTTKEELVIVYDNPDIPHDIKEYISLDNIKKLEII